MNRTDILMKVVSAGSGWVPKEDDGKKITFHNELTNEDKEVFFNGNKTNDWQLPHYWKEDNRPTEL